jgi:DNA-binding response OmpR family regulator
LSVQAARPSRYTARYDVQTSSRDRRELTTNRVLIIDDEPRIRQLVEQTFQRGGYAVDSAPSAAEGFAQLQRSQPDLVLLDVMMPDVNGLELCRRIRTISAVPIIMLTGLRNETDIVAGLQAGADDYVTKPFSPLELLARAEAALRRRTLDIASTEPSQVVLDQGRFVLNFDTHSVKVDGREQPLTPREFALLGYLALHAGRVIPHDELIRHVWGAHDSGRLADLRTYVKLLRRKIEPEPANPRYLQSRLGAGYMLPKS